MARSERHRQHDVRRLHGGREGYLRGKASRVTWCKLRSGLSSSSFGNPSRPCAQLLSAVDVTLSGSGLHRVGVRLQNEVNALISRNSVLERFPKLFARNYNLHDIVQPSNMLTKYLSITSNTSSHENGANLCESA